MIAEIVLPYSVRLVPRRGRRVIERVFRLSAPVEIKECTKKAAPVAFVIRRARSGRPNLQVRSFEGALWWELLRLERYRMTRKECLEVLRDGSLDIFGVYSPGAARPTFGIDDVVLKRIISSNRDSAAADAARKAGDLLFCGNHVYRRGGEPVYIAPDGERMDVTDAACLGPAIDPRVERWWRRFGHDRLMDAGALHAISEGRFFVATATARELPSRASILTMRSMPSRLDPVRLRFDAACRRAWEALRYAGREEIPKELSTEHDDLKILVQRAAETVPPVLEEWVHVLSRFVAWSGRHRALLPTAILQCHDAAKGALAAMREARPDVGLGHAPPLASADDDNAIAMFAA